MSRGARVRDRAAATLRDWWSEPRLLLSVALTAPPLVLLAVLGWSRRWISDDALIAIRTSRYLYDGDGPVYNLGERVEAGTSTIWVFFLAGLHAVTRGDWGVEAAWSGLLIGLAGFVLGTVAAARLSGRLRPGHDTVVVPIGIVVIAALPAYWDFLTSGLETGLIFGWLGLSYWLLVHRWLSRSAHAAPETPWLAAAVIGLGPLVRPDLGLVTLVFAWCLWRQSTWTRRTLASAVVAMVAAPLLWQVFRMGYYAAIVPNTALAKSAGSSDWGFGADYLSDFAGRYWLVLPLVAVAYLVGRPLMLLAREVDGRGAVALVVGPPVAALLHAGYVVRIGGDFMHGRMLLPATMCALLPVMAAAVPVARRGAIDASRALVCLTVVVAWGSVVGVNVRPEPFSPPDNLIADERAFYVLLAQFDQNPVSLGDFRRTSWYQAGYAQEQLALTGVDRFVEADFEPVEHPGLTGEGVVARRSTIGHFGFAAPHVFVADSFALADPVGARLELPVPETERPGHNQVVPLSWHLARFTPPSDEDSAETRAARAALQCGALADLVEATSEPMDAGLFLDNLLHAVGYTRLSIPGDPIEAEGELC